MKTKFVYAIITFVSAMLMLPAGGYAKTCKGTIFVEVGEEYFVDVSYGSYVTQSGYWKKSNSTFIFVSQGQRSCKIRGNKVGSGTLDYWGLVNADVVECYWNVVVTPTQPKLKVSATPSGGDIISGDKVYLTASADGSTVSDAEIYYTTDGTAPSMNGTYYKSSGVTINQACTLKAIAYKGGYKTSDVGSWNYTVEVEVAAINATNFPDDNFRNYLLEKDYGKDGRLTEKEIKSVTYLNVDKKEISSLKGIEYFTALTYLSCYDNQLTALDVSKNTALTNLSCSDNQLTALDVSKNTALTKLYCGYNSLTALDVSGCTALTELYCWNNQLTALDVSGCIALTRLNCRYNQLTALNVSGCTALTDLTCYNNQLTALDISKNTALTELWCFSNQLTALNVSKNTALTKLACGANQLTALDVSKNTALTDLSCYRNQLTSLDVSKNTALTELSCGNNQLTTLDVSKNTALTELWCNNNQLTALDVSKNTELRTLYVYVNQIKGASMDNLINSLPTQEEAELYVVYYLYKDEGNVCTKEQVKAAKKKGWRVLNGNQQEYEGSDDVEAVVINVLNFPDDNFRNYLLEQDYGKDGKLTEDEIKNITILYVDSKGIRSLQGIEHLTALTTLWCYGNQLTALDVSKNTALTELRCYNNQLTALDISKNIALTSLALGGNQLTVLDVSKNTALTRLTFGGNQLRALDVSKNTALQYLDCSGNQLKALDVSKNTALQYLKCSGNELTALDVSGCTALTELYCSINKIKGGSMDNLINSLPINYSASWCQLFVYSPWSSYEENVCTKEQVQTAKEKGWITRYQPNNENSWYAYEGSDNVESVVINVLNFPDDNFRNYLLEQDYGKDGKLTEEEIKKVTELNVIDKGISSLKGVEYFTALTVLDCHWNKLTALDVSKNIALTELRCSNNQLTDLDVSRNTALTYLNCCNNQLTALDISRNIALTELGCWNNQLTALDVSKNTALTYLNCSNNQLTALDVSKNTALTRLDCGSNQLTTLDVSKNTALIYLGCYNNQLTALDVSKNIALTDLHCYRNQIKGASMDNLIKSLPINYSATWYRFVVYSPSPSDEGNVCTKEQVKAVKERGWIAIDEEMVIYEGSDDTPSDINGIRTEAGKDAPVYNLRGQRLTAPQKGVNIIGGRKVVVK